MAEGGRVIRRNVSEANIGSTFSCSHVDAYRDSLKDEKAVKKQYPSLDMFKEQIDFYENLHEKLKSIDSMHTIHKWFRSDMKPFKQSLLNNVKRWSYAFKKHLTGN